MFVLFVETWPTGCKRWGPSWLFLAIPIFKIRFVLIVLIRLSYKWDEWKSDGIEETARELSSF